MNPHSNPRMQILSLGAGVQSSTLALMAAHGELPMPDCAIFADTQWEPKAIYTHLNWLEKQLPFPMHRVTTGSLLKDLDAHLNSTGNRFAGIPFWLKNKDGSEGMGRRECTREYKIDPVAQKIRRLLGLKPRQKTPDGVFAEVFIGISTDEAVRMKPAQHRWIKNSWPLIDKRISRSDCLAWFSRNYPDQPLVKSACIGCPFTSNEQWRWLKNTHPEEFQAAVALDEKLRRPQGPSTYKGERFLHKSRVPLGEADIEGNTKNQPDLFNNICEGMCGV